MSFMAECPLEVYDHRRRLNGTRVNGDPTGLPPLILQVGEVDVNRRDTEAFALRARMAGVLATLDLTVGAVHGFQGIESVPEAVEAWGRAAAFVARCTAKG